MSAGENVPASEEWTWPGRLALACLLAMGGAGIVALLASAFRVRLGGGAVAVRLGGGPFFCLALLYCGALIAFSIKAWNGSRRFLRIVVLLLLPQVLALKAWNIGWSIFTGVALYVGIAVDTLDLFVGWSAGMSFRFGEGSDIRINVVPLILVVMLAAGSGKANDLAD